MEAAPSKLKPRKRRQHRGEVLPRDYIEYAGLRIAVFLVRALPVEAASAIMGWGWRVFGPRTQRHKRVLENLAIALPHLDEGERTKIALDQWENLGRTSAESFHMERFVKEPQRSVLAIGLDVEARLRAPGGLVFVSMHSANWEVSAMPLQRYRVLAGLYQLIKNPLVDAFISDLRTNVFPGGLFTKGIKTPGYIMSWIRDGNAVCMLADHREGRGIEVTVFGKPTRANPFPAMVARRLGVPMIAGRAVRLPRCRFRVDLVEIPVPATDDPKSDVALATQALQERFEGWIRERPGEWMWVQDRWRETRRSLAAPAEPDLGACQPRPDAPISPG